MNIMKNIMNNIPVWLVISINSEIANTQFTVVVIYDHRYYATILNTEIWSRHTLEIII